MSLPDSRRSRPEMALIVAIPGPANGNIAEALRAGAHEIVLLPAEAPAVTDAVHKAMARASTAPVAAAPAAAMAPIVAVLGPKGGVGKTTVSTNLATVLAATGKRVLLVDLDLQFGDVGLVLGVEPERTIYDLVTAEGEPRRRQAAGVPGHQCRRCRRPARSGSARPGRGGDRRAAGRGDRRRPSGVRRRHRRHATGVHGHCDRRRRPGGAHRGRRLARPARSEEHEGRHRDAPSDGRQRRPDDDRPQPGRLQGRPQPGGREGHPRPGARHQHPVRPLRSPSRQCGHADRHLRAQVAAGEGAPPARRAGREAALGDGEE